MDELSPDDQARFEQLVLPHINAAFNFACWILRNRVDAEDVAQEALLRAYSYFRGFQGGDARAWLLKIVSNTCYSWLKKDRAAGASVEFDEKAHGEETAANPESTTIAEDGRERLTTALEALPVRYREVIVLRELEGFSYKEIAVIMSIPVGTVMSTLSRARHQLRLALTKFSGKEPPSEM